MKFKKYRIVKDSFSGYECQGWKLWYPFWVQMGGVNTHKNIDDAKEYIRNKDWEIEVLLEE